MEVLLVLGLIWLVLATGVVGLCAAAQCADRQTAAAAIPRHAGRRRARLRGSRRARRPVACVGAAAQRGSRSS